MHIKEEQKNTKRSGSNNTGEPKKTFSEKSENKLNNFGSTIGILVRYTDRTIMIR